MNILDLPADQFVGALQELQSGGYPADQLAFLRNEYRKRNSVGAGVYGAIDRSNNALAAAGRDRAGVLPMSKPHGMSGLDAIMSGQAQFAMPGMVTGGVTAAGLAAEAPGQAAAGYPFTPQEAQQAGMDLAALAMVDALPMRAPAGALRSGGMGTKSAAQEIADLLKAGRAADITDAMMGMADPQELARLYEAGATGAAMPMDAASRMARAKEMGFDTGTPLYRGDELASRHSFDTGRYAREGIGVTASDSPNVAATYMIGDNPAMFPLTARSNNPLALDAGGRNWTGIAADARANGSTLDDLIPPESYLDDENLFDFQNGNAVDWGDGESVGLAVSDTNSISRAAQGQGFDQVRFGNVVDRGQAGKYHSGPANDPHTTVMTADPANIRSRFARFDPRLKHLAHLSAGLGAAAILPIEGRNALAAQPQDGNALAAIRQYWLNALGPVS